MHDNTLLPASIRQRLELAQSLMNENRPKDDRGVFAQACVELARTSPEMAAILMAAVAGKHEISWTSVEERHSIERVQHSIFGIPIAEEWIPTTSRITTTRTITIK